VAVNRDSERIYDEFLVAAAVAGDRAAWTRLVARWHPRLLRHAWRLLGDADRARDLVQEAWTDIVRGLARLDDLAAFPAWAYRITTRRCQRAQRRERNAPIAFDDDALEAAVQASPVDVIDDGVVDLQAVHAAIATLPPPQRAALALFYLDDLSVAEIAIATDVAPGTVKTRLMHARRKLRALLEGDLS
jgi:RNA polymerase sigma factor (sigma-70 family)